MDEGSQTHTGRATLIIWKFRRICYDPCGETCVNVCLRLCVYFAC